MADKSALELFLHYFPGALRTAIEEVIDAQTPFTIERNKHLYNKRTAELEEFKNYLLSKVPMIVEEAVETTEQAVSRPTTPQAVSRPTTPVSTPKLASRSSTGSTVSAGEWQGGRSRKTKRKTRRLRSYLRD